MARKKKTVVFQELLDQLATMAKETAPEQCTNPEEAYCNIIKHFEKEMAGKKECFVALYLDGRRRIIHQEVISIGTLTATLVHPREVYGPALIHSAASLVVAHNHPSGDPAPSREDQLLTERLLKAGQMLGINLDDHLVIGKGCFASMRQLGLLVA